MKRLAIILAGFATVPAHAGPDTDYPHRDWGKVAILDMTVAEATACVAREMRRHGPVLSIGAEGGNDIDWTPGGLFQSGGAEPWITFRIRSEHDQTRLRVLYRHPIIAKGVDGYIKKLEKRCLKVARISPA